MSDIIGFESFILEFLEAHEAQFIEQAREIFKDIYR
jgi:hypothetical protein